MTETTSIGTHGKSGRDTAMTDKPSPIRSVKNIPNCGRPCGRGRVLVTFENGRQITCHDDGSFWQWTGGQNNG